MYSEIHQLKNDGLKKSQIARRLGINIKTVRKYWSVEPDEFAQLRQKALKRFKKLNKYKDVILNWIKTFPDISAAQIMDWLKEHYNDYTVKERTLRYYISNLRKEYKIPKVVNARQYEAVLELPMGKQMQVDFGEKVLRNSQGGKTKVYGMGTVLSHSRYKYAEWSDKPLTTAKLISMLVHCFEYMGGIPEELVFDQDKLVAVSENYGDIIYTQEFEKFKQTMGFKVRLCRKSDPESKGMVEAVIKYLKYNFADHRLFTDINTFNQECLDWLDRTGNAKVHGTTKKVPAQVFLLEKQYLKPIPFLYKTPVDILTRTVKKDNTISYYSNRYTVPYGTYKPDLKLKVKEDNNILIVTDPVTDKVIAEHPVSTEKGVLIRNNNHLRQYDNKIEKLYENTLSLLGGTSRAAIFLETIRKEKSRYVRDQYNLIRSLAEKHPLPVINQALEYCCYYSLYSAVDFRDAVTHFLKQIRPDHEPLQARSIKIPGQFKIKTEVRNISAYTSIYERGDNL